MQIMDNNHMLEQARSNVVRALSLSPTFKALPIEEQRTLYRDLVEEEINKLAKQQGLVTQMAGGKKDKASDLIDDERHNKGFTEGVDAYEDLVDSVDFPKFVADLLKGVFDANISVMKAQTDDYIRLMKEATKGVAQFIKQIDDTTTFAYLAENNPDQFGFEMEENPQGGEVMKLTRPDGEKVDVEDNEVKVAIMQAKIALAQQHRAALRDMMVAGITRLVVERGEIEAGVLFEFHAKRNVEKKDRAMMQTQKSKGYMGGGGFLGIVGIGGGMRGSSQQTQLSVSSTKSTAQDELTAKLSGKVKIVFKTDYFKLDNFATMYGPASQEEQKAAASSPAK